MPRFLLLLTLVVVLASGCDSRRIAERKSENDSLRKLLIVEPSYVSTLREVTIVLDSIDLNRNVTPGATTGNDRFSAIPERLIGIHQYVTETEKKAADLQRQLEVAVKLIDGSLLIIDALESEIGIRKNESIELKRSIEIFRKENRTLFVKVRDGKSALGELHEEHELTAAKLEALNVYVRLAEAESIYARAKALEEKAKREGKPNTDLYNEVLELYAKASTLGAKHAASDEAALRRFLATPKIGTLTMIANE